MKIKDAVYEEKTIKVKRIKCNEVYGCDNCSKEIANYPNEEERLEVQQYYNDNVVTDDLHFCSWDCVLEYISKAKANTDYFIQLPHVVFDSGPGPRSGYRLIELLSKLIKDA